MNGVRPRAAACWGVLWLVLGAGAAGARDEALLAVTRGQMPNDTGSDGQTTYTIEESKDLGGRALKVDFAPGDSVGVSQARVTNWKPFVSLRFAAFNPTPRPRAFTFTVRHRRTTGYQTRVDVPFTLKPGRTDVVMGIDEMLNVNGTAPDLANVVRWYIACDEQERTTVFFGDLVLEGADEPAAAVGGVAAALPPATRYRVRGKIGDMEVDLVVTPEPAAGPAARAEPPRGDPARLERIRAAAMPPITAPVLFNTPEADAILGALEVFPPDNPWNQVVDEWPLHPNSQRIIDSIGADKPMRYNPDMGFILVPPDQKRVDLVKVEYAAESDKGPFPIPDEVPIEGWPAHYRRDANLKRLTLDDVQRDRLNQGGDRHALVVDPVNRMLYEFFVLKRTDAGWTAAQASVFDLKTNRLRPDGWTSADAAGLPIFPAVVRYDELKRGLVEHAMRVTVRRTRRAYVAPATHYASALTDPDLPRMGERIRLKRDFDVTGFSPEVQAILKGLKKYGMFVADNGIEWAISVAPDERIPVLHEELRRIRGSAFEVVVPPR